MSCSTMIPCKVRVVVSKYSPNHGPRTFPTITEEKLASIIESCLYDLLVVEGEYKVSVRGKGDRKKVPGRLLHPVAPDNHHVECTVQFDGDDFAYTCFVNREGMSADNLFRILSEPGWCPPEKQPIEVTVKLPNVAPKEKGAPTHHSKSDQKDHLRFLFGEHVKFIEHTRIVGCYEAEIKSRETRISRLKKLLVKDERDLTEVRLRLKAYNTRPEIKSLKGYEEEYQDCLAILCPKEVGN